MRAMRAIAILQLANFFLYNFLYYIYYNIYNIKIKILFFYNTLKIPFGAHGAHGTPLL